MDIEMGAAFTCDVCGRLVAGNKPMTCLVQITDNRLGRNEARMDICVECGLKVKAVLFPEYKRGPMV